ncbi:hypothetical protein EPD60_08470 [Flaviaesturariibacter flavus]|uniref:Right-handed parallel beta-helix repeat-containing protein n=1 Tax=Flaviaesturariibacter flavus TaxID=2502780 RepID=A0A4R1BAU0_9BACT|nr:choice-of-anchor Q domain-containing protein [Flaviaesturariibacter flavus]TCJ14038.1 hypothetical protein EPD60_08470 [Flaviaesturariibacter flavus]
MKPAHYLVLCLLLIGSLIACRKDRFTNSAAAPLRTNVDTLHFDTVFTSAGSTSGVIKIFNDESAGVRISSVRLAGGAASPFRINVDGIPGPEVRDLELAGNDSLYVFVTVTIQPNGSNLPFIVQDSIEINWNGNRSYVQLDAYGQNARFLRNSHVQGNTTWDNTLPYVILGSVTVDTAATLRITEGTRVYFHGDAPMIVHGRLEVTGDRYDSTRVLFTGDRLDLPYRDFPASWPGIFFSGASRNNELTYAVIRNAFQGVAISGPAPATQLTLRQCIIDNAYDAGLLASNSSVIADNLLVSNSGSNIQLTGGGDYRFTHCTSVSYSNSFNVHKQPVLVATDFDGLGRTAPFNGIFRNCIFWGEANGFVNNEVELAKQGATFNAVFDKVLWRVRNTPSPATVTGAINNQEPLFDSVDNGARIYNFRLAEGSPAIDKGSTTPLLIDLDGKPRSVGTLPDLGAYERQ